MPGIGIILSILSLMIILSFPCLTSHLYLSYHSSFLSLLFSPKFCYIFQKVCLREKTLMLKFEKKKIVAYYNNISKEHICHLRFRLHNESTEGTF